MPLLPHFAGSLRAPGLICCVIVALQACGRSDVGDYYFDDELPNGGSVGLGGASNTAGKRPTGGKSPGQGGTSNMTAGSSAVGGAAVGGAATGGAATGGAASAGTNQGGFAQAGTSVGGTGQVVPITCGGQICDALTETCCATLGGFGCIPEFQECSGALLNCGSSSDCGGQGVCCLQLIGEVDATADCKSECEGMGPGRERRLCTEDSECSPNRPFCRDTTFGIRVCTRF
jgi:hypothetical protein